MIKENDMKVNNRVRWHSAAGILEGTVKRVDIDKNRAGDWIEWFVIGDMIHTLNPKRFSKDRTTRIPATMLAALKVEVI
tara:strand:+ start:874 stop:1110 length:237 start_codon:yes stop_codon:yes gene_type:complete